MDAPVRLLSACVSFVWHADDFNGNRCGRPAKWLVTAPGWSRRMPVCGIHVRKYRDNPRVKVEAL